MTRLRALRPLIAGVGLLAACAYYNGLYNANDLAHRAEKAEREGRTFDAQALWGQVTVKAETVLARHPHSHWTDEARYLEGRSLEGSGDCRGAIAPLERVVREANDPRLADDAAFRLSGCQARLGDLEAAGYTVERFLQSPEPLRRDEARWRAGASYRRTGRADEAVTILRTSGHRRARGELAAALAAAGRTDAAIVLADSLLIERDSLVPWGAVVGGVGTRDVDAASALLDSVIARIPLDPDTAAAWLTLDARRLLPEDEPRSLLRLEAAYAVDPMHALGVEARLTGLRYRLERTDDPALLDSIPALLGDIDPSAGEAMVVGRKLTLLAKGARRRLDSLDIHAPQGDIKGFLLGELLRDSLHAPMLAARVWHRVLAERPESPYAPKILIALGAAGLGPTDSIAGALDARYAGSPYVLALHGRDDPGFQVLEDSLKRTALALRILDRPPDQSTSRPTLRPPVRGARPAPRAPTSTTPVQ